LLAHRLVQLVAAVGPSELPGIGDVGLNGPVIAYALLVTTIAVLVAGLAPAFRVARGGTTAGLRGTARGSRGHPLGPVTSVLVGSQVALAVMVAVGSGLMLRSLDGLMAVDPGIEGDRVLAFRPTPPQNRYPDPESYRDYYSQVIERVSALPGVDAVGGINLMPGRLDNWSFPTHPEGYVVPAGAPTPVANFRAVRSGYFQATGIPVLTGRAISGADRSNAEPVVLVNETFVETFWPGEDPLGKTLSIFSASGTSYQVVGLVADTRQHGPRRETQPEMYFSDLQIPWDALSLWIVARVRDDDPMALAQAVRETVWEIDPDVPISGVSRLAEVLNETTATTRFMTWLLTAFGALALALCAIGVFGVTAYSSGRRKAEFGVRLALGASRVGVVASAVSRSLGPILIGLLLGTVGAVSTTDYLASSLYGIEPRDPVTFAAVVVVMAAVGLLAAAVPAWRASRVDPVRVLGSE
ncbi:MAG: FtsX-like permease family protein, partial [Gemmatimonadetes bacterium]|nr:FtsX-like permease family protein [Gemmatimonadota bacterium]